MALSFHNPGVIITHEHYDHCDLDALAGYRHPGIPVVVPQTVPDTTVLLNPPGGRLSIP
jgi:L-ascorbate metabolism protein UlaG (beta-lactamase superfamily)